MNFQQRIKAFARLGSWLGEYLQASASQRQNGDFAFWSETIKKAGKANQWFTEENVLQAISAVAGYLHEEILHKWAISYGTSGKSRAVGVIMAGNIPLVGFHDFLCVLISGHKIICKLSGDDNLLLPAMAKKLCEFEACFAEKINFTDGRLNKFDAIVATGSNNTSRYFEYYFGKHPHIIRRNRNAVAVLEGDENEKDLQALSEDVFSYFGLGCRSVSKLYVPAGFDFTRLLEVFSGRQSLMDHHKYANNYHYQQAVHAMNKIPVLDSGNVLLKEDTAIASPVAMLFYQYYKGDASKLFEVDAAQVQCVVSGRQVSVSRPVVPFGRAQFPGVDDYADGVDSMAFLNSL